MKISIYADVKTHDQREPERVKISLTEKPRGDWWKCENPNDPEQWFIAPLADLKNITPVFELTPQASEPGRTVEHLVYQAIYEYNLDPARVLRAVCIMAQPELIKDKFTHFEIKSDIKKPAYIVTRGTCTCEDHKQGKHVCKHRIAAGWTRQQTAPRNRIFTFSYCLDCFIAHWMEDGELCHGKDFDPRLHINNARFKMRRFADHTEIEVIRTEQENPLYIKPLDLQAAAEDALIEMHENA